MQPNERNPIRVARKARGWTLRYMAKKAGVHVQALYLNECGCYPGILPDILDCLVRELHVDFHLAEHQYGEFIKLKRRMFGDKYNLYFYSINHLGAPTQHPIISLREGMELSRMGFAKSLCVQPTLMYNVENCLSGRIPTQITDALTEAKMPSGVLSELCQRYEEWSWQNR